MLPRWCIPYFYGESHLNTCLTHYTLMGAGAECLWQGTYRRKESCASRQDSGNWFTVCYIALTGERKAALQDRIAEVNSLFVILHLQEMDSWDSLLIPLWFWEGRDHGSLFVPLCLQETGRLCSFTVCPIIPTGDRRTVVSSLLPLLSFQELGEHGWVFCIMMLIGERRAVDSFFVPFCLQEIGEMWFTVCRR